MSQLSQELLTSEPVAPVVTTSHRERRSWYPEAIITLLFAAAVAVMAAKHEPWADEAQAWLIAKQLPFFKMLFSQVRYEGTPGLWHSLLWILSHVGLPYASLGYFSCLASTAGVWVLVRYAPFPLIIRAILPFTFYFCYQFAVVSRSYVLVPLLLFAACHLFLLKQPKPVWFGVVAGLLANCSVFGLFISAGLALIYLWHVIRPALFNSDRPLFRKAIIASVVYTAFVALAVAVALPPKDLKFIPTKMGSVLQMNTGTDTQAAIAKRQAAEMTVAEHLQQYTTPLSHSLPEGLLFIAVLLWQLRTRRMLIAAIPALALVVVFELVYKAPRHMGLFFVVLIASMWLGWPPKQAAGRREYRIADVACGAFLLILCVPQAGWALAAARYDWANNYSAAQNCADFLKANAQGKKVFGYGYYTVAVAAYFDNGIFVNQPGTVFWPWSTSNHTDFDYDRIQTEKPDYLVLAWNQDVAKGFLYSSALSPPVDYMLWAMHDTGYKYIAMFKGKQPMRGAFAEQDFFQIYQRDDSIPADDRTSPQ